MMHEQNIGRILAAAAILAVAVVLASSPTAGAQDKAHSLVSSVRRGDLAAVKKLLAEGVDANAPDSFGDWPLKEACIRGYPEIVRALLEKGADVNAKTPAGVTALMLAAESGHLEVVKTLLFAGADGHARTHTGYTALGRALCARPGNARAETVRLLLENGADPNGTETSGETVLMMAAGSGDVKTVKLLLENGADASSRTKDTLEHWTNVNKSGLPVGQTWTTGSPAKTALDIAFDKGHTEVVALLKAHMAKGVRVSRPGPSVSRPRAAIESPMPQESSGNPKDKELLEAYTSGRLDRVNALLADGAHTSCSDPEYSATPLHWAASQGHKDVVARLIEKGASINALNRDGRTRLMMAAGFGHRDVVELLLGKGADTSIKDNRGHTALNLASTKGHKEIAKLLKSRRTAP